MLYADDTGIVSKSAENLAKISVIVTVFAPADLTVPEPKTEKMQFRTLNKVFLTPPLLIGAAGQIYIYIYIYTQTMHFLYLGAVLSTQAPTLCRILTTD